MRFFLPIFVTMLAFAANSILTRVAVNGGHIDPGGFALVRVLSGAVMLAVLVVVRRDVFVLFSKARMKGAVSLTVYIVGFSLAYLTLDAGLGALILFGVVQIVMFGYAALTGAPPMRRQVFGALVAFVGLLIALWPSDSGQGDIFGAMLMVLAGIGWAAYTIIGRSASNPLAASAANFILCLPFLALAFLGAEFHLSTYGIVLGVVCGAVTSGLGYALWYSILPQLDPATAATVQLSVPIIAIFAGVLLLGETLTLALVVSSVLVVGGVAWAIKRPAP